MKCLLCGFAAEKSDLIKHYVNFHNVAPQNYFFKYLFLTSNEPLCIEYCRCNQFTTTKEYQRIHNFLEHYSDGKKLPFEEKPIEIKNIHGLTTYEISFEKHADYYNFSDSDVSIKCGFSIQNIQQPPTNYTVAIVNSRYWSTDVYRTTYFNDHVFSSLSNDIRKRVIVNGLSGSSWRFSKFLYLNLKVLRGDSTLKR